MKKVLGLVALLAIAGGVWFYFSGGGALDLDNIKEKAGQLIEGQNEGESDVDHHYFHSAEKPHAAEWSYDGDTGPEHWGDLDKSYSVAKTGKQQSPIDIQTPVESRKLPELELNYVSSHIHLINNGHTIKQTEDEGSFVNAGGGPYELKQFHFHSPSEHTVDGEHYAMEMHLVHKSRGTESLAVVAVFIEEGEKHNDAFDPVWDFLPKANQPQQNLSGEIDPLTLVPKGREYFTYDGSFTTPPCTEGVKWIVLRTPVSLSKDQIDRFRAVIKGNFRPVQNLNGREIVASE